MVLEMASKAVMRSGLRRRFRVVASRAGRPCGVAAIRCDLGECRAVGLTVLKSSCVWYLEMSVAACCVYHGGVFVSPPAMVEIASSTT